MEVLPKSTAHDPKMNISTLTPIKQMPKPEEVSILRPTTDSATIYNAWRRENELVKSYNQILGIVNQMSREIDKLKLRKVIGLDFYPFCIYSVPSQFRQADSGSYTNDWNWSTVRIRNGAVLTSVVDTSGSSVYGTDNAWIPDDNTVNGDWNATMDYIIPAESDKWYFWIEALSSSVSGSSYFIQNASSSNIPLAYIQSPWTSFPSASVNHIPIGFCDNFNSASSNTLVIRQYQRTDVVSTGGSGSYVSIPACLNGTASVLHVMGYFTSGSV